MLDTYTKFAFYKSVYGFLKSEIIGVALLQNKV